MAGKKGGNSKFQEIWRDFEFSKFMAGSQKSKIQTFWRELKYSKILAGIRISFYILLNASVVPMKVMIIFLTALAVMLQTIDGRSMCPPNEKFLECGSACEPSCDRPVIENCTLDSVLNECQCFGIFWKFVRDHNGNCIRPSECPNKADTTPLPQKDG
ncbi:unnamed protein product [Caenorhabditis brenneri]